MYFVASVLLAPSCFQVYDMLQSVKLLRKYKKRQHHLTWDETQRPAPEQDFDLSSPHHLLLTRETTISNFFFFDAATVFLVHADEDVGSSNAILLWLQEWVAPEWQNFIFLRVDTLPPLLNFELPAENPLFENLLEGWCGFFLCWHLTSSSTTLWAKNPLFENLFQEYPVLTLCLLFHHTLSCPLFEMLLQEWKPVWLFLVLTPRRLVHSF